MPTVGKTDIQTGMQPVLFSWGSGRPRTQSPRPSILGQVPGTLPCSPPDPSLSGRLPALTTGPSKLTPTPFSENNDSILVPYTSQRCPSSDSSFPVLPQLPDTPQGLRSQRWGTKNLTLLRLRDQKATAVGDGRGSPGPQTDCISG